MYKHTGRQNTCTYKIKINKPLKANLKRKLNEDMGRAQRGKFVHLKGWDPHGAPQRDGRCDVRCEEGRAEDPPASLYPQTQQERRDAHSESPQEDARTCQDDMGKLLVLLFHAHLSWVPARLGSLEGEWTPLRGFAVFSLSDTSPHLLHCSGLLPHTPASFLLSLHLLC